MDSEKSQIVADYISDYIDDVETRIKFLHEFILCFKLDEDDELSVVEAGAEILRRKIEEVRNPESITDIKRNLKYKKIKNDAIENWGEYDYES